MRSFQLTIPLTVYDSETELPDNYQLLLQTARQATQQAYAPYSNFQVGAAVLLNDGTIIKANNQENAAYPSGSCAEQSLIFWVGANYPTHQIEAIAVTAYTEGVFKAVSPCGACRQALLEYEHRQKSPIRLFMLQPAGGVVATNSIADMLPVKFDADDLKG
ncbi:MAG: cytidine deaminase [Siphonobacter sp.]